MTAMEGLFKEMSKIEVWCSNCGEWHKVPELIVFEDDSGIMLGCPKACLYLIFLRKADEP